MIIFPAIDLRGGRVVRLRQGRASQETVYSDNPAGIAQQWQKEGAQWLHIVDLDRAFGDPGESNVRAVNEISAAVEIPIQLGGGLRDLESVTRAFSLGANRVVVGTMAVENPAQLKEVIARFGAGRIVVALDTQAGRVVTRGWRQMSDLDAVTLGKQLRGIGVERALVTDTARDGMLTGIEAEALAQLARETGLGVIASGGIATLDDLRALRQYERDGIEGAIVGQALYAGVFSLKEAIQVSLTPGPSFPPVTGSYSPG
jgi:phosphoribosylformimino-5-aminoimidazole carboxamide ribotide isomerase